MTHLRLVAVLMAAATGCSNGADEGRTIVASIYPLAFAAERVAGPAWEVIDLTPPGTEAHDLDLSLEQRAALEDAAVVLYLGPHGFQPQLERAILDPGGEIRGAAIHVGNPKRDPHWWLDPELYEAALTFAQSILEDEDPEGAPGYEDRALRMSSELDRLQDLYRRRLANCEYSTAVVTHEAFGYLADRYGFHQLGLEGITPEGEPSVARLARARVLLESDQAGAIFFDEHENSERRAQSLSADWGVPALPLSTLESQPLQGDFFTVMENNLESLREGLGCR